MGKNYGADWTEIAQVDEAIEKTQARITTLEARKAELQASGDPDHELASIESDLKHETGRLNTLRGDRKAMSQDWL